jgi:hypothetical protein
MSALARAIVLSLVLLAVAAAGNPAEKSAGGKEGLFRGACYCKTAGTLECTANLTERECRRQCDEALCDDWFWKERLPCWNWGYGG